MTTTVPITHAGLALAPKKPRKTRNQNACDACRARKVKCHYDAGDFCRSCLALNVLCLRKTPRRKRGPPNLYLEAQQRARISLDPVSPAGLATSLHFSPVTATATTERVVPRGLTIQILDDWFTFVHPVAPILHHDSFLAQFSDPIASQDPDYVDLVLSVCAATIATLPRRASAFIEALSVEKCYTMVKTNRSSRSHAPWSLARCQTDYNLAMALSSARGMDDVEPQLLLAAAITGVSHLLHYDFQRLSFTDQELLKRLHWLCVAAQCTMGLHSRPYLTLSAPSFTRESLMPLEITDAELGPVTVGAEIWHGNTRSYIPGLNALSGLFLTWLESQQGPAPKDLDHWRRYMATLDSALDYVIPELRWRGGLSRPVRSNFGTDIQMVNLSITQIHIRSFIQDQISRIAQDLHDRTTMLEVDNARQALIDDMLAIVFQVPEDTLEANGYSLIPKLRAIGLSLLDQTSDKAFANLDRLLAKLERLDVNQHRPRLDSTSPIGPLT